MISILTGDNPFYLEEKYIDIPDFILERFFLEECEDLPITEDVATIHRNVKAVAINKGHSPEKAHELADKHVASLKKPQKSDYKHSTVSKHMTDDESSHVSHAIKSFRDHVEAHGKGSVNSIHKHIESKTKMRSKSSGTNERGHKMNTSVGKLATKHNLYHTHAFTNDGHQAEPSHKEHENKVKNRKTLRSSHTADHVIHWTHKNGKVHVMGVSRHNKKNGDSHMSNHTRDMVSQNRMNENKN